MKVTIEDLVHLPLHDADFILFEVRPQEQGGLAAFLVLVLHADEYKEFVAATGLTNRRIKITFSNCWIVESAFWGHGKRREELLSLDVVEPSPLLQRLRDSGAALDRVLSHVRIELSAGSRADVVAESVGIEDFS